MSGARPCGGFTITELIMVIALIVLLMALLLPVLGKTREGARVMICGTKQRQLMTAVTVYANDNNDTLPAARQGQDHSWVHWGWDNVNNVTTGILYKEQYMTDLDTYICPTFKMIYRDFPGNENKEVAFTYSMSEYVNSTWKGVDILHRLSRIIEPSKMLAFTEENPWSPIVVDGITWGNVPINNGALGLGAYNNPADIVDCIATYHYAPLDNPSGGLANVTFFDGHTALHHASESKELGTPDDARY